MNKYEQAKIDLECCQNDLRNALKRGTMPSKLKFWEDRCIEAYEIMKRLEDESI